MADPSDIKNTPGYDSAVNSYSTVTKTMQTFASEMQRMSKETVDSTSHLMEKLRGAKTMEEVVAIQTSFMQQSFSNYADFTRRFSEMMMSVPMELAKNRRSSRAPRPCSGPASRWETRCSARATSSRIARRDRRPPAAIGRIASGIPWRA